MSIQGNKKFLTYSVLSILLITAIIFGIAAHDILDSKKRADLIEKKTKELRQIQSTLISIQNIESGVRGYAITGDDTFLNSYYLGINQLTSDTTGIQKFHENEVWKKKSDSLLTLIRKKIEYSTSILEARKKKGEREAASIIASGTGLSLMNGIRDKSNQLIALQLDQIGNHEELRNYFTFTQPRGIILLTIILFLIQALNFYTLRKGFNRIDQLNQQLSKQYDNKSNELNIVFERITEAFIALDNQWNYTYINPKAALMYNLPIENIIGKNIWEITPQIADHPIRIKLLQAKEMMKPIKAELFHPETNQWFENWIYPDEQGISVYYREITDRKEVEQNILETQQQLELLNERFMLVAKATNDAIWDWQIGSEFVWGNEAYRKLFSETDEEFIRLKTIESKIHKDDLKKISNRYNEVIHNKLNTLSEEFRFQKNETETLIFLNRVNIIFNEKNEPCRIVGSLQDITEQRKIQQQILHEKEMSDVLINSLPGVFYMFNKDRKYIRWNKNIESVSGYTSEEFENLDPIIFVPEDQRALLASKIANVFNYGIDNAEADLLTKDGRRIPYYFTGIYIRYNDEDCMMGVGIDISDRLKYQQELIALTSHLQNIREEERTNIAREIHDELGQQLTGIKMSLSHIRNKYKAEHPELRDHISDTIAMIDDSIKSVRKIATELRPSILDDLGLISALEWQTEEFQKRYFINAKFESSQQDLMLSKEKSTAIFRIYQECLTNILRHSNATELMTRLFIHSDRFEMIIVDNGVGFDQEEIRDKKTLGILGMKERASMLGGSIELSSKTGSGTKLTLSVPMEM